MFLVFLVTFITFIMGNSILIVLFKCVCVQVHLTKLEYHEKGQYFLSLISESETHILNRFITHRVKYFKPLFLEIFMIMAL